MNKVTSDVTQADLDKAKKVVRGYKDKLIEANTLLSEVDKNIDNYNNELRELGVDPDDADNYIKDNKMTIVDEFNSIVDKINDIEQRAEGEDA